MDLNFLLEYNLGLILVGFIGVCSLAFLLLQAFFHDKNIAIVALVGLLASRASLIFPAIVSNIIILCTAVINLVFISLFLVKHYKSKFVFIPIFLMLISMVVLFLFAS
ncbi:hypothetical protein [Psychromonas algicola]|uniref:hypothetical protein n=1 Tax=Psychromonas algicola TaxID=2555642 RepID=UPI001067771B|nr:hypothetical protein [Psychromonas sp. RZ5]TEW50627.1 hypothetical protein E2R67_09125 [Psychromonas sp. RZ5]